MERNTRGYLTADEIYDRTMKEIVALPCQESYARELAEIFSYHMKKNWLMDMGFSADELPLQSAVIVAPSGQGKSFLLRKMAQVCGVNAVVIECSTLSHEGWRGISLSEKLSAEKAHVDPEKFARSVILVDEVDKLHSWGTENDQGSPQENLLQLYSGDPINYKADRNAPTEAMETKRWTVLLAGAFAGLENIVSERIAVKRGIGFTETAECKPLSNAELIERAIPADLTKYGMMNELIGRIGTIIPIHPMGMEDYRLLINGGKRSALDKHTRYLSAFYGVSPDITEAAVEAIARKCMGSQTGARAVNPLIDAQMRQVATMLDRDREIGKVTLDADGDELRVRYEKAPRKKTYSPARAGQKKPDMAKPQETEQAVESKVDDDNDLLVSMVRDFADIAADGTTTLRSGTVTDTVNFLYMLYEEGKGDFHFNDMLRNFLRCSIMYLQRVHPQEPISISALFHVAVHMQKGNKSGSSRFDKDVVSAMYAGDGMNDPMYNAYEYVFLRQKEDTPYRIVIALNKISQMLWQCLPQKKRCVTTENLRFDIKADQPNS